MVTSTWSHSNLDKLVHDCILIQVTSFRPLASFITNVCHSILDLIVVPKLIILDGKVAPFPKLEVRMPGNAIIHCTHVYRYMWEHEYTQFNRAAWLFQHAGLDFSAALPVADLLSSCYRYIYTHTNMCIHTNPRPCFSLLSRQQVFILMNSQEEVKLTTLAGIRTTGNNQYLC